MYNRIAALLTLFLLLQSFNARIQLCIEKDLLSGLLKTLNGMLTNLFYAPVGNPVVRSREIKKNLTTCIILEFIFMIAATKGGG